MTGKELIMYILSNNLEDKPVFRNGIFVGYTSVEDAAVKMNVGYSTIYALMTRGELDYIRTDCRYLIPANFNKKGE